jgi:hypothetical protein
VYGQGGGAGVQSGSVGWFLQQLPSPLHNGATGDIGPSRQLTVKQVSADAGKTYGDAVYGTIATINISMNWMKRFFMIIPLEWMERSLHAQLLLCEVLKVLL